MKKKKFSKLDRILRNVVIMAAATEAVCGRKFMKWQLKRMQFFPEEVQIEIWLQVGNRILPTEMQISLSKGLAKSSIIRDEAQRIFERILKMPMLPADELFRRIDKIVKRRVNKDFGHGSN